MVFLLLGYQKVSTYFKMLEYTNILIDNAQWTQAWDQIVKCHQLILWRLKPRRFSFTTNFSLSQ